MRMSIVLVLIVPIVFALFPIWMDKLEAKVLRYDDGDDANIPMTGGTSLA